MIRTECEIPRTDNGYYCPDMQSHTHTRTRTSIDCYTWTTKLINSD